MDQEWLSILLCHRYVSKTHPSLALINDRQRARLRIRITTFTQHASKFHSLLPLRFLRYPSSPAASLAGRPRPYRSREPPNDTTFPHLFVFWFWITLFMAHSLAVRWTCPRFRLTTCSSFQSSQWHLLSNSPTTKHDRTSSSAFVDYCVRLRGERSGSFARWSRQRRGSEPSITLS